MDTTTNSKNKKNTPIKIDPYDQSTILRCIVDGFIRKCENELIIPISINDICFSFYYIFKIYQDLLCYVCGDNIAGKMIICNYEESSKDRNDAWCRDGYCAVCPSHKTSIGLFSGAKSMAIT